MSRAITGPMINDSVFAIHLAKVARDNGVSSLLTGVRPSPSNPHVERILLWIAYQTCRDFAWTSTDAGTVITAAFHGDTSMYSIVCPSDRHLSVALVSLLMQVPDEEIVDYALDSDDDEVVEVDDDALYDTEGGEE